MSGAMSDLNKYNTPIINWDERLKECKNLKSAYSKGWVDCLKKIEKDTKLNYLNQKRRMKHG